MDRKDAYERKIAARLEELDAEVDRLRAKAAGATADAQLEAQDRMEELEDMRRDLRERFDALKAAGDDAREELVAGLEDARKSLSDAVQRARLRFS